MDQVELYISKRTLFKLFVAVVLANVVAHEMMKRPEERSLISGK